MVLTRFRSIVLCLCTAFLACTVPTHDPVADAPKSTSSLIVLLVADTTDHGREPGSTATIAPGVIKNRQDMTAFFQLIGRRTGLALKEQDIVADDSAAVDPFNCGRIASALQSLRAGPDDAVLIYYSGHGFNIGPDATPQFRQSIVVPSSVSLPPDRMPYMYCGSYGGNPNADDAARWARTSRPRLVVVMFDSCNSYVPGTGPAPQPLRAAVAAPPPVQDLRLISLFAEAHGSVIMAGAEPGSYSFYTEKGGMFTQQFLKSVNAMPPDHRTTWQALWLMAKQPMDSVSGEDGKTYRQQPIAEIN